MAFIEVPNCATLILGYRDYTGREFSNGFSFEKATPYDLAALNLLISTGEDAWAEYLDSMFNESIALVRLSARALDTETSPAVVYDLPTQISGTRSGTSIPLHSAMSVTMRTGLSGRSRRGRIYHTGLVQADMNTLTTWDASAAASMSTAYSSWAAAFNTATAGKHVIISRQQGGVGLAEGIPYEVTGHVGRIPIATMRRRVSP